MDGEKKIDGWLDGQKQIDKKIDGWLNGYKFV